MYVYHVRLPASTQARYGCQTLFVVLILDGTDNNTKNQTRKKKNEQNEQKDKITAAVSS
jgi:hypothetical protein